MLIQAIFYLVKMNQERVNTVVCLCRCRVQAHHRMVFYYSTSESTVKRVT